MKALAAFLFQYSDSGLPPGELRLVYETGFLDIDDTAKWFKFHTHHARPCDAAEMIEYHRRAVNWKEIEL